MVSIATIMVATCVQVADYLKSRKTINAKTTRKPFGMFFGGNTVAPAAMAA